MVFFNWATMQMAAKIVYYGPGLCGKTSNLSYIYAKTSPKSRGEMVSLETESDRTLFFDLLPIEVGTIGGFKTRLQLYTVPGQVFYNTTRKLVLKGVDGLVFVADSQRPMREANIESFKSLIGNIEELGLGLEDLPLVLQFNKRDLENILSEEELLSDLNPDDAFLWHSASAINGDGVFETLKEITKVTLKKLRRRMAAPEAAASPRPPTPAPAPPKPASAPSEPVPATQAAPISASSLARAAEEGAGSDFPVPAPIEFPALADTEIQAPPEDGMSELPPEEGPTPEEASPEMPVDELDPDEAIQPPDSEPMAETELEDLDDEPSANEITAASISDLPAEEPFGPPGQSATEAFAADEPMEAEPLEEIGDFDDGVDEVQEIEEAEEIEEVEEVDDDAVEFDTGTDDMPDVVPPPVKRVHVTDESGILAQLDDLRRHATESTFSRTHQGPGHKELDLDSLLAGKKPRTRDLKRHIEHSLNSNLFEQMGWMQVAFRIQNEDGDTIHTLDAVSVKIQDASDLEELVLQLTIDLKNIR